MDIDINALNQGGLLHSWVRADLHGLQQNHISARCNEANRVVRTSTSSSGRRMYLLALARTRLARTSRLAIAKRTKKSMEPRANCTVLLPAPSFTVAENPGVVPHTCAHCLLLVIAEPCGALSNAGGIRIMYGRRRTSARYMNSVSGMSAWFPKG